MVTAVSDTAVNATDDVTAMTAVLIRETTVSQNQASDPNSRLLGTLAPGVSRGVSQITTAIKPTDAAASSPNAVVRSSNMEADPVVSPSGAALVVTDGTVPTSDTVMAFINKVSPSTQAVPLTTEAVAQANDVIASAMDYAAPTTISASMATDEFAQTTNEMNSTIIPATGGIALVTKNAPLSAVTIPLALDYDIRGPGAASTTKAIATDKNTPSPALHIVPPINLPAIPAVESAETVPPDASFPMTPSKDGFNLEALAPEPKATEVAIAKAHPPDMTLPEAPAPEAPPPALAVTEAPLPEASTLESPPTEAVVPEGHLQIPASKSISPDPASLPEALPPGAPFPETSAPESPPLDTVGSKASLRSIFPPPSRFTSS